MHVTDAVIEDTIETVLHSAQSAAESATPLERQAMYQVLNLEYRCRMPGGSTEIRSELRRLAREQLEQRW